MILERELIVYKNKQSDIVAYVNTAPVSDPVVRFVKFCVKSNEEFNNTRVYLIDCLNTLNGKSDKDINSFLGTLINIDEVKGDNDVIFILRTHKLDLTEPWSNNNFIHFIFDETVENSERRDEYFICDYAQIGVASLIADMQSKLKRSGEKWY